MGRRSEKRVQVNLPVRVWGVDQNGNPFLQSAYTIDVAKNGARLRDLFCLANAGEVICIQHGMKKAKFIIQWIGHPGTQDYGHVGIHCMEPDKYIWGVPLTEANSPDTFAVNSPDSPSFHAHGRAASACSEHSLLASTAEASNVASAPQEERRVERRLACTGTAEVGPEGSSMPIWCGLSDLSSSGCYAETTTPLPVNTRVYIRLRIFGAQLMAHGTVRNSYPGVGMGISLSEMSAEDQGRLHSILEFLTNKAKNGLTSLANPNPVSFTSQPMSAPWQDRSLLLVHNRPQQENGKKAPAADPQVLRRLEQLGNDLEELPPIICPDMVDMRILHEFKSTMDYARQMTGSVQLWIELQSQNHDPFHVIHQLNEERVHTVAASNHRLATDLDGGEIDFDTSGLKELYESTRDLHTRLQKLFKKA